MKFTKRILAVLLLCVMTVSMLTACGGGSASSVDPFINEINQELRIQGVNVELRHDYQLDMAANKCMDVVEKIFDESATEEDIEQAILDLINDYGNLELMCFSTSEQYAAEPAADLANQIRQSGKTFTNAGYAKRTFRLMGYEISMIALFCR